MSFGESGRGPGKRFGLLEVGALEGTGRVRKTNAWGEAGWLDHCGGTGDLRAKVGSELGVELGYGQVRGVCDAIRSGFERWIQW